METNRFVDNGKQCSTVRSLSQAHKGVDKNHGVDQISWACFLSCFFN